MKNISYWERALYTPHYVIIGSGFLGLWTAFELSKLHPDRSIVILERDPVPYGASYRNAGFLSLGSIGEFLEDEAKHGTAETYHPMIMRLKGIEKIKTLFSTTDIGLIESGSVDQAVHSDIDQTDRINYLLGETVFVTLPDRKIFNTKDCTIESNKLYRALLKLLPDNVTILSGADIKSVESAGTVITTIQTIAGRTETIYSKKVVACMNGFTYTLFPDSTITPVRNHVLVVQTKKSVPEVPEYAHGGHVYMRKIDKNQLLIGGGRNLCPEIENTAIFAENTYITRFLKNYAAQLLSVDLAELTSAYTWSGIMGFTPDKQNLLQQHTDGIFSACCCNGIGVSMSSVWAETVAAKVE